MRVTTSLLIRFSAVTVLLFAAGHLLGAANSWSPLGDSAVLQSMREFSFDVMGTTRSYWHFYYGFGLYIGLLLAAQGVALWQAASLPAVHVRPLLVTSAVTWAAGTVILWQYIFIVPVLFSIVCSAGIIASLISASRADANRS